MLNEQRPTPSARAQSSYYAFHGGAIRGVYKKKVQNTEHNNHISLWKDQCDDVIGSNTNATRSSPPPMFVSSFDNLCRLEFPKFCHLRKRENWLPLGRSHSLFIILCSSYSTLRSHQFLASRLTSDLRRRQMFKKQILIPWAVVVAQLVVWSLPIPQVRSSNPVIGKIYIQHMLIVNCIEKTKIK